MEVTKSSNPFWRQGDIYFVKLQDGMVVPPTGPVNTGIIARGEHTGHMHRLSPTSMTSGALLYLNGQSMYLRAPQTGATIVHDEHQSIDLPEGTYAVVLQREFDGFRWREVLD